jgi:hypothetical protein
MHGRTVVMGGVLGGLLVGCLVAGCSGSSGVASSAVAALPQTASGAAVGAAPAPANKPAVGPGSRAEAAGQPQATVDPVSAGGRQVIRTATITVRVPDVAGTAADVRRITDGVGGYTGAEDTEADHADFTLQVPESSLDQVLDRLAALGRVTDRSEQAQDVTDQLVDVRSRVASQQASVDRVRALLAQASSIGDIVTIEGELSSREADLESLEQRQAELAGQVAMATVTVHIGRATPVAPPVRAASSGFLGGLSAGWHSFLAVLGGVLVVFGTVLPYLLGLGIPLAVGWWLWRRRRPVPDAG